VAVTSSGWRNAGEDTRGPDGIAAAPIKGCGSHGSDAAAASRVGQRARRRSVIALAQRGDPKRRQRSVVLVDGNRDFDRPPANRADGPDLRCQTDHHEAPQRRRLNLSPSATQTQSADRLRVQAALIGAPPGCMAVSFNPPYPGAAPCCPLTRPRLLIAHACSGAAPAHQAQGPAHLVLMHARKSSNA
jgi:hypothetical protein